MGGVGEGKESVAQKKKDGQRSTTVTELVCDDFTQFLVEFEDNIY